MQNVWAVQICTSHIRVDPHITSMESREQVEGLSYSQVKWKFLGSLSVCSLETVADFELTWQSINFKTEGPSLHFAKLWNSVRRTSWLGRECEVEGKSKACNQLPIMSHCEREEKSSRRQQVVIKTGYLDIASDWLNDKRTTGGSDYLWATCLQSGQWGRLMVIT